ncbi:MAG: hypothetical protein M1834_001725 [Cirrosporium novae-zelandiae]|nr:MAG: hypothetical protein M1834_001725 [Cirrosporium novae-zelandiae]
MFQFNKSDTSSSKCFLTTGSFPAYVDHKQPPTKKKPFSTILSQPCSHSAELILPKELYDLAWTQLEDKIGQLSYRKIVKLPLSALLEGEFFNSFIKTGNILMLSEGRPGVDNVFSLINGTLRLNLDKETYERAGLVGRSIRDGGRKHVKARYVVELNLRQPSMLHGKKGFERIVWAFKNSITELKTWLFCDLQQPWMSADGCGSPENLPKNVDSVQATAQLVTTHLPSIRSPPSLAFLDGPSRPNDLSEFYTEIAEWLALVSIESPRLHQGDNIDSYLCRYDVPGDVSKARIMDLVKVTWRGFLPSIFVMRVLLGMLEASRTARPSCEPHAHWFSLSVHALEKDAVNGRDGYVILKPPPLSEVDGLMDLLARETGVPSVLNPIENFVLWDIVNNS